MDNRKRTAIFCFYDREGLVYKDIYNLLRDIRTIADYVIIVVNGHLQKDADFQAFSDMILMRDNVGYDVSAYKYALFHPNCRKFFDGCEELVLVNSTFFGPFISLEKIFLEMEENEADFWGLSSSEVNFVQHLQSYFLVYRKKILSDQRFYDYFRNFIHEEELNYINVLAAFENGLFHYLLRCGYQYDAYVREITCDNYKNPYGSLVFDRLPILKKKIFEKKNFSFEQVLNAFKYIKYNYNYDLTLLFDYVQKYSGVQLTEGMIDQFELTEPYQDILVDKDSKGYCEVEDFIWNRKKIYIYGAGERARTLYIMFIYPLMASKLNGFIVSDDVDVKTDTYLGYPLKKFSEISDEKNVSILVGLNKENSNQIKEKLKEFSDVCYMYRGIR